MAYEDFIPQNIALPGTRRIGIYDSNGNRVGQIPLGTLTPPPTGKKIYSFGALADVHLQSDTAQTDFQRALSICTTSLCVALLVRRRLQASNIRM